MRAVRRIGVGLGVSAAVLAAGMGSHQAASQETAAAEDAVVLIRTLNSLRSSRGTGFVVGDGSWVVTASHVVAVDLGKAKKAWDKTALVYSPWTGRPLEARVAAVDGAADIAVLKLPVSGLPTLPVEGLDVKRATAAAAALQGRPLRLFGFPLSYGEDTVASVAKAEHNDSQLREIAKRGETSLCVLGTCPDAQPGWSGGPILARDKGVVVGVFHSLYKASAKSDGYPAGSVCGYLGDLLKQAGVVDLSALTMAKPPTLPRPADAAERMAHEMRTLSLSAGGNWKRAEAEQREILKTTPNDAAALTELGKILLEQERYEEAIPPLKEAVRATPQGVTANMYLARALHLDYDPKGAEAAIKAALAGSPGEIEPLLLQAEIQEANQQPEAAEATLRGALQAAPEHPVVLYRLGALIGKGARVEEGRKLLAQAAELSYADPGLSSVGLGYARALEGARKFKDAEEVYRRTLKADPENAIGHYMLSQLYLRQNRIEDAQVQLNRAINLPHLSTAMEEALRALQVRINERSGGEPKE